MDKQKLIELATFWSSEDVMEGYIGTEDGNVLRNLAEIALAALEARPCGIVSKQLDGAVIVDSDELIVGDKIYTIPPAASRVPDEIDYEDAMVKLTIKYRQTTTGLGGYIDGWNACRAAMLANKKLK